MTDLIAIGGGVLVWAFIAFFAFIPLFVWMQLRQIIKLLKKIADTNERIAENTRSAGQKTSPSSVKYNSGIDG
jgi:hypothetical protein